MKTYKQYLNENLEQIDYDNGPFNKIWNHEIKNPDLYYVYSYDDFPKKDGKIIDKVYYVEIDEMISYYKNGLLHRDNGPAMIIKPTHTIVWFLNGKEHRDDGPAHITFFYTSNDKGYNWAYQGKSLLGKTDVPEKLQWDMIKKSFKNLKLIPNPIPRIQEFIIINHPEYINDLKHIDNDIKQKYSHIITGEDLGI